MVKGVLMSRLPLRVSESNPREDSLGNTPQNVPLEEGRGQVTTLRCASWVGEGYSWGISSPVLPSYPGSLQRALWRECPLLCPLGPELSACPGWPSGCLEDLVRPLAALATSAHQNSAPQCSPHSLFPSSIPPYTSNCARNTGNLAEHSPDY